MDRLTTAAQSNIETQGARKRGQRRRGELGASAIEYGLIAGLIAVVLIGALTLTGTKLSSLFSSVASSVDHATPSS